MERFGNEPLERIAPPPGPYGDFLIINTPVVETDRQVGSYTIDKQVTINRLPPNNSFGNTKVGNWQAVKEHDTIKAGDVLRLTYRTRIPFFQQWQVDRFISDIQKDDRYQLLYWSNSEEERRVWVEVKVIKPDFGITAILIAAAVAAIGVGIGFMLITESIEKLVDPESILGIGALIVMGIIGVIFFSTLMNR